MAGTPEVRVRRVYDPPSPDDGHDPRRFAEFRLRYAGELREPVRARALTRLNQAAKRGTITLLTATRDTGRSQAALLAEQLRAAAANRNRPGAGEDDDVPGDPACWLRRVCAACGSLAPVDPPTVCPECGGAITEV